MKDINLITGSGRSATKFTSELLKKMGYDYPHETHIGEDGIVSWYATGVDGLQEVFTSILHQVRNPIDTISSIRTMNNWKVISKKTVSYTSAFYVLPEIKDDNYLKQCMKYWYHWNKLAESVSEWTYKVEDLCECGDIYNEWCSRLKIKQQSEIIKSMPKNIHTRKHDVITIDDLYATDEELTEMIREYSKELGYEL